MEQQYQAFPPRSEANKTASMVGAIGGGCAVLIGLILLVAFFLPWGDGESAFDAVTQDLEADHLLGELLYKLIFASTGLAGLGSVIFGLLLATGSQRGAAFRAWMSTSIGSMVVVGGFLPGLLLSYALLGNTTDELEIGIWLSLGGVVLLAVATLIGLSSALTRFKDSEIGFMASGYGGRFAVAIGLLLVVAFFLPWGAEGSAFDIVKEDLGADNFLGELLYKLIFASTALAGIGSVIFGLGWAVGSQRGAAFRAWMTTSVGGMGLMAGFLPTFIWSTALIGRFTDMLKIGVWLSLGAAVLLVLASLVDLSAQQGEM
jgi:hypothetical protein